jgi:hypothetical protein
MPTTRSLSVARTALLGVLVGALGFAVGSLGSAEAGPKPVTKAQVKTLAAKQARREIAKAAPSLRVAHADTAGTADSAESATSAVTAAQLAKAPVLPYAVDLAANASPTPAATLGGLALTASCPGGVPTLTIAASTGKLRMAGVGAPATPIGDGDSDFSNGPLDFDLGAAGAAVVAYRSSGGVAVTATIGWRSDNGGCQLFGTLAGG